MKAAPNHESDAFAQNEDYNTQILTPSLAFSYIFGSVIVSIFSANPWQ
jgi:hypothetical protein